MTYLIHEDNMERLEKKLAAISKKCAAFGCEFSYKAIGETFQLIEKRMTRFVEVEASGKAQIGDWEFIATVEHSEPMNIIRKFAHEIEVPALYYTTRAICEHCNSIRNRKDTYIIRNIITGEFKQVGKSCLKDYTNGLSAEAVARYISCFDQLIQGYAPDSSTFKTYYNPVDVLAIAVQYVSCFGYAKSNNEYSITPTWSRVAGFITGEEFELNEAEKHGISNKNIEAASKAETIMAWIKALKDDFGYATNLKAVANLPYIRGKHFGILVSGVASYNREIEYTARKAAEQANKPETKHVGQIGERITVMQATITVLTGWETDYGYTYLYKLVDVSGNIFTWKTGKDLDDIVDSGKAVNVKGTIKAHNEFRGDKQTELTRCKIQ